MPQQVLHIGACRFLIWEVYSTFGSMMNLLLGSEFFALSGTNTGG